ncbi:hypothetical protein GH808_09175 [Acetobacterium fimetarium]|uniref:2-isopropylmalate synthase/homocitrate synthase post-catalytic domain-containing protein n=1 Tax=Acetobacterium fimetarium TaxID=52691 RepID=A0ABR6WWI0_9FIRM|nr:hypothetical protein [Acetobacterium fimetarium]MBC3804601.1 hypothetical protein [Acetobacterium fimetarium]
MVTIIDRTLTALHTNQIQVQDLSHFCDLLFICGVTKIELPATLAARLSLSGLSGNTGAAGTCFLIQKQNGRQQLFPNDLVEQNFSGNALPDIARRKIRLTGMADLISRDYRTFFEALLHSGATTLDLCPSNSMHCATAIALEWIFAGGSSVSCAFSCGHDFPRLEEVLMGLKLRDSASIVGDLSVFNQLRNLYEKMTRLPVSPMKAVIGTDIFKVESGIHVDGVLKNSATYEPFSPQTVGSQREIVLGKHSSEQSVLYKLREQNLSETGAKSILKQIKEGCSQLGRNISDLELYALASEVKNDHQTEIYC